LFFEKISLEAHKKLAKRTTASGRKLKPLETDKPPIFGILYPSVLIFSYTYPLRANKK